MKSKQEDLIKRGFLTQNEEAKFYHISFDEKIKLLKSKIPTDRTIAARLLANSEPQKTIEYLIEALIIEKKLYSKIEICNTLYSFKQLSVKPLIEQLGKIGTNQHKKVPETEFKKNNYPLPRDIASRTLIRIGKNALPELIKVLNSDNKKQLSEAIDTIGFICFYDYTPNIYIKLEECYKKNNENELIKWKIIRAMSSFTESKSFLNNELTKNKILKKEIERSIMLIEKRTEK